MENLRQTISAAYLANEDSVLEGLIAAAKMTPAEEKVSETLARDLVSRLRASGTRKSGVDAFTQEYALSSEEGVVLMCLAEALLRIPDADTQDRLIPATRSRAVPGKAGSATRSLYSSMLRPGL